jgi:flagellin
MTLTVNTNMQALKIQDNLNSATDAMNTAMERMSSGSKINSAKDDAAGLAVSTTLSTTISSSKVATSNVKIGQDLLSTAEGTLDVISDNLTRVRDLTEQASNGTYSDSDKEAVSAEVEARVSQITSLASGATFNDTNLFSGDGTAVSIQSGTGATDQTSLDGSIFADAGAVGSGLFKTVETTDATSGVTTATLQVQDETGAYVTVYKEGSATSTNGNANTAYSWTVSTTTAGVTTASATASDDEAAAVKSALGDIIEGKAVTSATDDTATYETSNFLNSIDTAISNITSRQTSIGAAQNQLTAVSDGLDVQQTNLTSALSTIQDSDVAEESAAYVQAQILQQASTTLLVQANSAPEIALTLIKG